MDKSLLYIGLFGLLQLCLATKDEVRLVNGKNAYSGVLQVKNNNTWGTVCNDTAWTKENTDVACKQLGFLGGAGTDASKLDDNSKAPIWIKRVNCSGDEWRLQDCPHVSSNKGCQREDDISIACIPPALVSCVKMDESSPLLSGVKHNIPNLTSGKCLEFCRKFGFAFASVGPESSCSCGAESEVIAEDVKVPFEECMADPCPGDDNEYCGAENRSIAYNVLSGNCGGNLAGKEGTISSPGYPLPYREGLTCIWDIELSNPDTKISIHDISLDEGDQIKLQFPDGGDDDVSVPSGMLSYVKTTEASRLRVTFVSTAASGGEDGFFLHFQDDTQCEVPSIDNGTLVHDPEVIYRPGDWIRVRCDHNLVSSNATITCKENGKWYPEPSCSVYHPGLSLEFIRTILIMVIVGLIALGVLFAITTIMLICIKANDKRQSGYQGITTEIVEAPQSDSIQEERFTPLTKDDIKVQLHSPDEDGEMDNNANEQHVIPAAEEDMDLESPLEEASPADETVEADESRA